MALLAVVGIIIDGVAVLRVKGDIKRAGCHLASAGRSAGLDSRTGNKHCPGVQGIAGPRHVTFTADYIVCALQRVEEPEKDSALFLQAVPRAVDIPEIEKKLLAIHKVKSVHHNTPGHWTANTTY
jgi:hypothetical protein